MIQITECKFTNPKINSNREIIFNIRIKREDYTNELWDSICEICDSGNPQAGVFQEFQGEVKIDNISSKRSKLAFYMSEYAKKIGSDENTCINKLYIKYGITSRRELSELELDEEIAGYKAGIDYD